MLRGETVWTGAGALRGGVELPPPPRNRRTPFMAKVAARLVDVDQTRLRGWLGTYAALGLSCGIETPSVSVLRTEALSFLSHDFMSFSFEWPRFSEQFHTDAIQMLNTALNKGNKPPVIADRIEVVELEMGSEPPELEIRDIGDLTVDQFRGIFRFTYAGDAHIVLKTKVQVSCHPCPTAVFSR